MSHVSFHMIKTNLLHCSSAILSLFSTTCCLVGSNVPMQCTKGEELFSFCDLTSSLISFTNKELTNSLLLASDRLAISVCVIWFDKKRFWVKSHKMTSKIPLLLQILGQSQPRNGNYILIKRFWWPQGHKVRRNTLIIVKLSLSISQSLKEIKIDTLITCHPPIHSKFFKPL